MQRSSLLRSEGCAQPHRDALGRVTAARCPHAVAQAWVSVGTGRDSPGDGYLQPLELLAAEEALASGLEEDYLLGYQLVALLLQPGHHPRLQEHLTASRGRCAPPERLRDPRRQQPCFWLTPGSRDLQETEGPRASRDQRAQPQHRCRAQGWGTWLPSTLQDWPLLCAHWHLLSPSLPLLCPPLTPASSTARCCKSLKLFLWDTALFPHAALVTSVPLLQCRSQERTHVHTDNSKDDSVQWEKQNEPRHFLYLNLLETHRKQRRFADAIEFSPLQISQSLRCFSVVAWRSSRGVGPATSKQCEPFA